ncbi:hypothetical protein ACFFMP_13680 [Pseudoroseomonas cervicalis]
MSLTSKEIAAILGPVDEDLLAELRSGASREEAGRGLGPVAE